MNKIKGLILKDLIELKSYKKNFLISIIIYILLIISNSDNNNFILIGSSMIIYLYSIYAISTFNHDEKTNSIRYYLTLPITKKDIVLSKYILVGLSIMLGVITSIILGTILYLTGLIESINIGSLLSEITGTILAFSIITGIQIPCMYKYGAEKGRLQMYIIFMIVFAIIGLLYMVSPNINLNLIDKISFIFPYILLILIFINYYISFKISLKIFKKKEV